MKAPVLQRQPFITRRPHFGRSAARDRERSAVCADMPRELAAGAAPVFGEQRPQDLAVLARHGRDDMGLGCGEVRSDV